MNKPSRLDDVLTVIRTRGPISPNDIAVVLGIWRTSVDGYLREARALGVVHVAAYGPPCEGGTTPVKLYAYGAGKDAVRPRTPKRTYPRRRTGTRKSLEAVAAFERRRQPITVQRDPFVCALFGPATALDHPAPVGRLFRLLDDEPGEKAA